MKTHLKMAAAARACAVLLALQLCALGAVRAADNAAAADTPTDSTNPRKEPLEDASHVRNAIARFDQVKGVSDAERDEAWKRIKAAAKKFDVEVNETSWRELGKG